MYNLRVVTNINSIKQIIINKGVMLERLLYIIFSRWQQLKILVSPPISYKDLFNPNYQINGPSKIFTF